jgi:hypothetical protein
MQVHSTALRCPPTPSPISSCQAILFSVLPLYTLDFYIMNPPNPCQEDQLFPFDETGDASWYKFEGVIPHKSEDAKSPSHEKPEEPKKIKDFDVSTWLEETRKLTDEARGLYRLVIVENPFPGHPPTFPMKKDRLDVMLCEWGFPPLHELLHAIRNGGSAVFKADGRRSMI